jgi:outer membrane protein OmpA-like peptidoglycan-associated protein
MENNMGKFLNLAIAGMICISLAAPELASAQEVTSDTILKTLKPKKALKRGVVGQKILTNADASFLDSLPARGIKVEQRQKLAAIIVEKHLPKIDVHIQFEFDSADISPEAQGQLSALATALSDPSMAGVRIALNGHTDAKGSDDYNLKLSEARATAVRRELVAAYNIAPERLIAVGFGEEGLVDTYDPEGPVNRRVEVVRITK